MGGCATVLSGKKRMERMIRRTSSVKSYFMGALVAGFEA